MSKGKDIKEKIPMHIYILVLMVILASKTVFFGIIHMKVTMLITLLFLILYGLYLTKRGIFRIKKKVLMYFAIFTAFQLVLLLFHLDDMFLDINSYMGIIVLLLEVLAIGLLVVSSIEKRDFVRAYVHIIVVIALISLIYFFWSMTNQRAVFNICNIYENGRISYIALPWYTYGWQTTMDNGYIYNCFFGRNAGPFWEPGAFQGFLLIAIFFLLSYKELFRHRFMIMIILLITLLTTQSTTGYIVFLISLLGYSQDYVECLFGRIKFLNNKKKTKMLIYIISLLFIIFVGYIILLSGNISNKFDVNNRSYIDRMTDINESLAVLSDNILVGIGFGSNSTVTGFTTVSATTIIYIAIYYGLPFTIYYLYRFIFGCKCLYEPTSFLKKVVLLASFIIILMSETLYLLPMYAIFLFSTDKWSVRRLDSSNE